MLQTIEDKTFAANVKMLRAATQEQNELIKEQNELLKKQISLMTELLARK